MKINYNDKQTAVNPKAPATNEIFTADNANEIKASVNELYDDVASIEALTLTNATSQQFEEIDGVFQIKQSWLTNFIKSVLANTGGGEEPEIPETPEPVDKPVITFTTITSNTIMVTWSSVNNISNYFLRRSVNSDMSNYAQGNADSNLFLQDQNLSPNTTYYYQIVAVSNQGAADRLSTIRSQKTNS